jgi:hypothetical protein
MLEPVFGEERGNRIAQAAIYRSNSSTLRGCLPYPVLSQCANNLRVPRMHHMERMVPLC